MPSYMLEKTCWAIFDESTTGESPWVKLEIRVTTLSNRTSSTLPERLVTLIFVVIHTLDFLSAFEITRPHRNSPDRFKFSRGLEEIRVVVERAERSRLAHRCVRVDEARRRLTSDDVDVVRLGVAVGLVEIVQLDFH